MPDYPAAHNQAAMMDRQIHAHPRGGLEQVCTAQEVLALQAAVREVYVDVLIRQYMSYDVVVYQSRFFPCLEPRRG